MTKLLAARTAQYPLSADFVFSFNDYATDSVTGVKTTFGSTVAVADPSGVVAGLQAGTGIVFDAIPMPVGAVIIGGEVIVENAFVGIGAGATLSLGIAGNTAALVSALDLDAAVAGTSTALLLTAPLLSSGGQNLRLTVAGEVATATAGKVRVRVAYVIDRRANETVIV